MKEDSTHVIEIEYGDINDFDQKLCELFKSAPAEYYPIFELVQIYLIYKFAWIKHLRTIYNIINIKIGYKACNN